MLQQLHTALMPYGLWLVTNLLSVQSCCIYLCCCCCCCCCACNAGGSDLFQFRIRYHFRQAADDALMDHFQDGWRMLRLMRGIDVLTKKRRLRWIYRKLESTKTQRILQATLKWHSFTGQVCVNMLF